MKKENNKEDLIVSRDSYDSFLDPCFATEEQRADYCDLVGYVKPHEDDNVEVFCLTEDTSTKSDGYIWVKGLRKQYELPEPSDDFLFSEIWEETNHDVLITLTSDEYEFLITHNLHDEFLTFCEENHDDRDLIVRHLRYLTI